MTHRYLMLLAALAVLGIALASGQTVLAAEQKVEFAVPGVV